MRSKVKLQKLIWSYRQRIDHIKQNNPRSPELRERLRKLRSRIYDWQKTIARIERMECTMQEAAEIVQDFTGITIFNGGAMYSREARNARNLFYKYCLENGVHGCYVAVFCGLRFHKSISQQRMKFTRSFKTTPANLKLWREFKQFAEQRKYQHAA